ncbi:ATP-binding protein [Mycobacterium kyogaense]|uniref:ATP-binding protein n=1 Tax=Mycobacterium kyogaense TaxID=2212479 RepID=UPI000DAB58D2|nr:AAA family ATPase [Mycobacterium kyogaense]
MTLTGRERQCDQLAALQASARAGQGGAVLVCGESGAGKTTFVEQFISRVDDHTRVLWGACDPLTTPRPLGPLHDVAHDLGPATRRQLADGQQPYDIFASVFDDLRGTPAILVIDDLQWADQATLDLFRFLLRRAAHSSLLIIGILRDDEVDMAHPLRGLLGDVARSAHGHALSVPPLDVDAIAALVGDRDVDPARLHRITGGNAFFVCEMLDQDCAEGAELPTTVRDAILARTTALDADAWDLLALLTCASGAIGDRLLVGLGVTLPALRAADRAKLIRRDARGVTFRHDLCRRAVAAVLPPGAEPGLHRRFVEALRTVAAPDPAVLTHHALGAGDTALAAATAVDAGRAATRAGAHTQACRFFELALQHSSVLDGAVEAEILELLAAECYLTDRLTDAIAASRRALLVRRTLGDAVAVSANHHALSVYEWYSGNRAAAVAHADAAVAALETVGNVHNSSYLCQLGHGVAMQAYLLVQANRITEAEGVLDRAREIAAAVSDTDLAARVELIGQYCGVLSGTAGSRDRVLAVLSGAPRHIDEIYSSGYTNLTHFDVEQRRLGAAADLLGRSIPLMVEHDLPICRMVQIGSRSRLLLLSGDWDAALPDADSVLGNPSAPLARMWPLLIRGLIALRRSGNDGELIDQAAELADRFGEPIRLLPVASAFAERHWLTGRPEPHLAQCLELLRDSSSHIGLEWARGELAVWLHRLRMPVADTADIAEPYTMLLGNRFDEAAEAFDALSCPYDAALARIEAAEPESCRRALDTLDRLGADAVAAKLRADLRARGLSAVPGPRRTSTLANPAGLTSRQLDVLRLLADGLTNAELAERLFLSVKTVDHHVSAILGKLGATSRRDAVRRAHETGLLTRPAAPL